MISIKHSLRIVGLLASIMFILAISACTGDIEYTLEKRAIEVEDAQAVQANIEMRSGDVTITGGENGRLLDADFAYNAKKEPPAVDYVVKDGQGMLTIEGAGSNSASFSIGGKDNNWNLAFNDKIPLALDVHISDADAEMDLSQLSLSQLSIGGNGPGITADVAGEHPLLTAINIDSNSGRVNLGLTGNYDILSTIDSETNNSDITLDLTGNWEESLEGTFTGGTSNDVTLILPKDVGVSVTIDSTNEVTADGFHNNSNTYTNDAYGETAVSLNINITFQRGDVQLTSGD